MAKLVDEQTAQDVVFKFILMNFKAGRFTQFAFDNLDFKEYIKDGRTEQFTSNKATLASKIAKGVDPLLELKWKPSYLSGRTTVPHQHRVALGECLSNCSIGRYKTKLHCFNMDFITGLSYT